ncbi:hypothetical protein M9458_050551 [Cirrhinus mrigala]|uniref:Uncharacterized protein n=1 Tax=Cirrhinus mrigala TaxID=683832 RepID=A0ABD0MZ43_CIRMR
MAMKQGKNYDYGTKQNRRKTQNKAMKQGKHLVESAQAKQYFVRPVWFRPPYMATKQEVTKEAAEGALTVSPWERAPSAGMALQNPPPPGATPGAQNNNSPGGWGNRGKTGGGMEGQVCAEEVGLDRGAGTDSGTLEDLGRGAVADSGTLEDQGRGAVADSGTLEDQGRGVVADSGTLEDLGRGAVEPWRTWAVEL